MSVDIIKDYLPWAPSLLTLAGWYLVNAQNNSRERRKEVRSGADRCKALARDAAQTAIKYWEGKPDGAAWHVKANLEELEVEIRRFPISKGREELNNRYVDLVNAIAAEDFESANMQKKPPTDPIMRCISRTKQALLHEVECQFERHFN